MKFSERTEWPSTPNALTQKISALRMEGANLLDLTVTNPTRCDFKYLDEKILKAFSNFKNLAYDPDPRGLKTARETVCVYYRTHGIELSPEQIFLTASTSEAYNFVFRLLADPHDSVLAPQPSYPLLDYLATLNDIQLIRYPLFYHDGWRLNGESLDALAILNPRAVLVVHPNNPTGNFTTREELAQINRICRQNNAAIISDEVFYEFPLTVDNAPLSFAANQEALTFTISGISKILGLPQMKLSWIIVTGPPKLCAPAIERLEIISDTFLSASTPIQNALDLWFKQHRSIRQEILKRISENHEFLAGEFGGQSEIKLLKAEGGWSAILKMNGTMNDEQWALHLLDKKHIITHPGFLYDFTESPFLVLSLLTRPDILREGVSRLRS